MEKGAARPRLFCCAKGVAAAARGTYPYALAGARWAPRRTVASEWPMAVLSVRPSATGRCRRRVPGRSHSRHCLPGTFHELQSVQASNNAKNGTSVERGTFPHSLPRWFAVAPWVSGWTIRNPKSEMPACRCPILCGLPWKGALCGRRRVAREETACAHRFGSRRGRDRG